MARYAVHLCDPGSSLARDRYTPEQLVEKCKCRHPRHEHWAGGGACGECGGRMDGRGCDYFRPRAASQRTAHSNDAGSRS